jgi:glutathione S-transferase
MLYIDDKPVLGQSKSIERFLAKKFGLMGADEIQAAQVDMLGEHIRDIKDAYQKAKAAGNADTFLKEDLPKWFAKLEHCCVACGTPGFAVGDKLSLAGLQIYSVCTEFFDAKEAATAAYAGCPRIASIVANVAGNEKLKAWQAKRKETAF